MNLKILGLFIVVIGCNSDNITQETKQQNTELTKEQKAIIKLIDRTPIQKLTETKNKLIIDKNRKEQETIKEGKRQTQHVKSYLKTKNK